MTRVFSSLLKEARHFTVTFKAADCFRTSGFKQSGNSMDDIWIHEERFCLMARSISLSSPCPLAAARHHVKTVGAAGSAQAVLALPFLQRIWKQSLSLASID